MMIHTLLITLFILTFTTVQSLGQTDQVEGGENTTEAEVAESESTEVAPPANDGRVEKLEVTGSYIRRTDVEGPSPVVTIDRQEIEASGFNTVGGILNRSTASPFGGSGGEVSLKGIGSGRTLVLINGQRAPGSGSSYASGAVNVNFVPVAAVERIEILKDGASATYGSDALGGVINIITRKDLDGFAFVNQYNMSTNIGTDSNRMSLAYGTQTAQSNLLSSLQFTYAQGNRTSDLDFAKELNRSIPFSSNYQNDAGGFSAGPNCTLVNEFGQCEELVSPRQVSKPSYVVDFVTDYSYEVGQDTTFFSTVVLGWEKGESEFPNIFNRPGVGTGLTFTAADAPIPTTKWGAQFGDYSGGDTRVFHRMDDYVNTSVDQQYTGALIAGLKGYFGDSDWQWDVSANNQISIVETNEENLATLSGTTAAVTSGAYDPFDLTQRDTSGLGIDAFNRNWASVQWLEAKTNGTLGSLLGFDWAAALGTSVAHFAYSDHREQQIVSGNVMMQAGVVGRGARELYSLFSEFSGVIGNSFEIQFSMRGDFYSDFGNTFNPKIAARYQPTKWLTFRTSAGTGFQAPTLQNMNAKIEGFDFLVDQVRCKDPSLGNGVQGSTDCRAQTVSVFQDNNADLKEETSMSFNFGTIIQPTKNFSVSLDWWYVKVENTIGAELEDILLLEERGTDVSKYTVNIIRENNSPTGRLERITYKLFNAGTEEANGVDLDMNYRLQTSIGDFRFSNEFIYMGHFFQEFYQELGKQQVLGQFEKPRWKNNATIGHSLGQFRTQFIFRSVADVEKRVRGLGKVVSPTQIDFSLSYDPTWAGEFQIGGLNILNIRPRFDDTYGPKISASLFTRTETYYLTYRQDF